MHTLSLILIACLLSGIGLAPCPARASEPKAPDELVTRIQSTYESLSAFDAKFVQVLRNTASGEEEERSGLIFFKKPRLIRWETTMPEKELLIVGSKEVWDYFDDDKIAYKYTVDRVLQSKTMIKFISGQARLDEDFWVTREASKPGEAPEGLVKLNLTPKEPEPQLVQAYAWADPKTGLVRKILLQDFYGNENELSFADITLNPKQPDDLFAFTPPAGVEIFDNTAKDAPMTERRPGGKP